MPTIRIGILMLIVVGLSLGSPAWSQQDVDFTGRVFDAKTKRGIENLEIKLTPPRKSKLAVRIATTDSNGSFAFKRLARSRYLLEVAQNVHLLYRLEVDVANQTHVDIPLERTR